MSDPITIVVVAGARPNFMKIASLMDEFARRPESFRPYLVHTGQHYDEALSKVFFDELGIPRPDENLEVGSGSHAQQTAEIIVRFEEVVLKVEPDAVLVVGDVNSTIACALVAAKLGIHIAHVEAGLRSGDRAMPEEINRVLTDSISDSLFVTEPSGMENLAREGVSEDRVVFAGNVMIDTLLAHREKADQSTILERLDLRPREYAALTLHRPSNVDDPVVFARILDALEEIGRDVALVFPVHPRTLDRVARLGLRDRLESVPGVRLIEPQGYLDFLKLQADAAFVLTDSGGVQEETTVLGVPCITVRENTERPVTITQGTNVLVGTSSDRIRDAARGVLSGTAARPDARPEKWDGRAGRRIADALEGFLGRR